MNKEDTKLLIRAGTASLRKAAGRKDYFSAVWTRKVSGDQYRIVKRTGFYVYVLWDALGGYPPRGMSKKYTVGDFLYHYELAKESK